MSASLHQLVARLGRSGIELSVCDGRLLCKAPKGSLDLETQNLLRTHKPELIKLLGRLRGEAGSPAIVARGAGGELPLSFAQERLWFLEQYDSQSQSYHVAGSLRMIGVVAQQALERSLLRIVERHEVLRTNFFDRDGVPFAKVGDARRFVLQRIRLKPSEDLQSAIETELSKPFDLQADLLIRASLLEVSERESVLLIHMHHIVTDGWSFGIQNREFAALYQAFSRGLADPLPPLNIQYSDYAAWQRESLAGEALARRLAYWKDTLTGVQNSEVAKKPRPALRSYRGDTVHFRLPQAQWQRIQTLCVQHDATPYMFMLAVFALLLQYHDGHTEVTIGSPVANRDQGSIEGLIGFFVNTLALRIDVQADWSFAELLQRVKGRVLEAFDHQDAPFEKVVDALGLPRDVSRTPLFQVLFVFQNAPSSRFELPDLLVQAQELRNQTSKFDLTLNLTPCDEHLDGRFEYATELFERADVEGMATQFQYLLEQILANQMRGISALSFIDAEAQTAALAQGIGVTAPYALDDTVLDLLRKQVCERPDSIALVCEGHALNYRELNRQANRVAHALLQRGIQPDARVMIFLERSVEAVIAIIAVLKMGGAYVPVDPRLPPERVAYLLADSGATAVLSHVATQGCLPPTDVACFSLDGLLAPTACGAEQDPDIPVSSQTLAYVIYTSGSTGLPKGVMIEHGSLSNYTQAIIAELEITEAEKGALATLISTDLGNTVLFPTLCAGGELHVLTQACVHDLQAFSRYVLDRRITFLKMTPSHFAAVVSGIAPAADLRTVVLGGERLPTAQIEQLVADLPGCRFFNHYGPTETCVGATFHPVAERGVNDVGSVPIGKPLPNVCAHVLDAYGLPLPAGVPGELYIGGAGVARGYLNRPELNTTHFVILPELDRSARFYRTGDRVRRLADGNLEFLGRNDDQVKINGYRVELGEVEGALRKLAEVKDVVVTADVSDMGSARLCAHLLLDDPTTDPRAIRRALEQHLPKHMIPSSFNAMASFPRLGNGKVDRKALQSMQLSVADDTQHHAALSATEKTLERIFCDVLKRETVSVTDNFFNLGGHSLEAVILMSKINAAFDVALDLPTLFSAATVRTMGEFIDRDGAAVFDVLVPIQPHGERRPLFAVPGAGGNVLGLYELAQALGTEQPFYGLQAQGLDGEQSPLNSVEAIAIENLKAIRRIQPNGPYKLLGHSFGGYVVYEMALRLQAQGEVVELVALYDVWPPDYTIKGRRHDEPTAMLVNLCGIIAEHYGVDQPLSAEVLAALPKTDYFSHITTSFAEQGIQLSEQQVRGIWNVYSTNVTMRYQPGSILVSDQVVLCRAQDNHSLRGRNAYFDAILAIDDYGWSSFVTGKVRVHEVPGDHETLLRSPNVQHLPAPLSGE